MADYKKSGAADWAIIRLVTWRRFYHKITVTLSLLQWFGVRRQTRTALKVLAVHQQRSVSKSVWAGYTVSMNVSVPRCRVSAFARGAAFLRRHILFRNGQLSSCLQGETQALNVNRGWNSNSSQTPIAGQRLTSLIYSDRFESANPQIKVQVCPVLCFMMINWWHYGCIAYCWGKK